jgi:hypothetical protein
VKKKIQSVAEYKSRSHYQNIICIIIHNVSDICKLILPVACTWFSPGTLASSTTKTVHNDIAEILLKVTLNTINQSIKQFLVKNVLSSF